MNFHCYCHAAVALLGQGIVIIPPGAINDLVAPGILSSDFVGMARYVTATGFGGISMCGNEVTAQIFEAPSAAERRREPRKTILKSGEILYRQTDCLMACVILDLSERGAMLKPEDPHVCPDVFILRIKEEACHVCQIAWREEALLGVTFIAELD